jgi:hypothetical protein
VSVSCLEHGRLLKRIRDGFDSLFGEFKNVLQVVVGAAASSAAAMQQLRDDLRRERDAMQVLLALIIIPCSLSPLMCCSLIP